MTNSKLSRRGFIDRSVATLVAAGLPLWYARQVVAQEVQKSAEAKKPVAANDKLRLGQIGCGGQGTGITKSAMRHKGVELVAVCDVDKSRREKIAKELGGDQDIKTYNDYRDLVARDDIDIVTIGTPDHWHALTAVAAMKAGKDVYCEKPLTLYLSEGQKMVKVARSTGRVLQTGSQQRSDARFRLACQLVRNGRIGKIRSVEARIGDNPVGGPFQSAPVPEGLDWDMWLGQTPKVDYIPERCHYEFRWWREYSGGKSTDWGAHHNDIAQWGLGMDGSGPVSVEAKGDHTPTDGKSYNFPKHFKITYTYANGAELITKSNGENGVIFEGENGWIFVSRGRIEASNKKLLDEPLRPEDQALQVSNDHMGNFLDCVRDRQRPICDVEIGHRSVSVCHLGNISLWTGRKLQWDPAAEQFVNDAEANGMLTRPMRAPWKLEV